ncbi:MAG TPA: barstar family protein [Kofleriaceae bacterium]|nr:barstar family protein [Kofleriaceae bacterium]
MLIDVSTITTKAELHELLAAALGFPEGMGRTWDGFWDCVTGDCPLPKELVVKGLDHVEKVLPDEAKTFLDVIGEYNSRDEDVDGDGEGAESIRRCAVTVSADYRCSMFYLLFEAVPTGDACFGDGAKGGLICCWVKSESAREAHRVARAEIESSGWLIVSQEQIAPAMREDYSDDTTGLPYYEQACIDGMTFVFHTWSSDEEEDGDDDDDDGEGDEDEADSADDIPRA